MATAEETKATTETKKTTKRKKSTPVSVETAEVEQKQIEQEQAKDEVVAEEAHAEAVDDNMSSEDQPDVAENERIVRYDIMITSERAGYRPPKAAIGAIVQQLAFRGLASPVDEAIAETWTEIYFEPGPAAHEIFLEKEYDDSIPVYREVMMRFCDKPFTCDYSDTPQRPLYWGIEIRGARFTNPLASSFSMRLTCASPWRFALRNRSRRISLFPTTKSPSIRRNANAVAALRAPKSKKSN